MADNNDLIIIPEELIIKPDQGFDQYDIFQWKEQGNNLITLLNSTPSQMVIALDSDWGSGKTTYLNMLAGEIRKQNGPSSVLYFDAFEVDYMDDPFIAITGELIAHYEKHGDLFKEEREDFQKRATKVGKILGRGAIKVGVKAITLGAINSEEFKEDFNEAIDTSVDAFLEKKLKQSFSLYKEKKEAFDELKKTLSELQSLSNEKPLIFIIDELDRCRPDFALRILEQVKHLFLTPNVHFILSADFKQLGAMVKKAYGNQYDANRYFHKFADHFISLKHADLVKNYLEAFAEKTSLSKIKHNERPAFYDFLNILHERHNFSLRDLQKVLANIGIDIKNPLADDVQLESPYDPVYVALAVMKIIDMELFAKARAGRIELEDFTNFYGIVIKPIYGKGDKRRAIQAWIAAHYNLQEYEKGDVPGLDGRYYDFIKHKVDYNYGFKKPNENRFSWLCQRLLSS